MDVTLLRSDVLVSVCHGIERETLSVRIRSERGEKTVRTFFWEPPLPRITFRFLPLLPQVQARISGPGSHLNHHRENVLKECRT